MHIEKEESHLAIFARLLNFGQHMGFAAPPYTHSPTSFMRDVGEYPSIVSL